MKRPAVGIWGKGHWRQAAGDGPQVSTCTQVMGRGLCQADERKDVRC